MSNRLYVGNLSFHTTEDTIREAFGACGHVDRVDLPTDRETGRMRGFAFVTMGSDQDAQRAIEELHGWQLDGRPLRVNVAEQKGGRGGGGFGGGGRSGGRGRRGGDRW